MHQSHQEAAVAALIQNSFGAHCLHVPKENYSKGASQREPADLAWINGDFVALFYLTESKQSLEVQQRHNLKQALGFLRRWKKNDPNFLLRSANLFGDEVCLQFEDAKRIVVISVVSAKSGIYPIQINNWSRQQLFLSIPDTFIYKICEIGGTIVDLLWICRVFVEHHKVFHIYSHANYAKDLEAWLGEYVSASTVIPKQGSDLSRIDYDVVKRGLFALRVIGASGEPTTPDPETRQLLSRTFGDLSLKEFAVLINGACATIRASMPPKFERWVVTEIRDAHYRFVINSINIDSNNTIDCIQAAAKAMKNDSGEAEAILITYANVGDMNDYRYPHLFGFPPKLPDLQSNLLFDYIFSVVSRAGAGS